MKLEIAVLAFRLLWTPNQEPDFSHYIVYSGENPASFSAFQTTTDTFFTGLENGYFYAIRAVDFAGNVSGFSETVQYTQAEGDTMFISNLDSLTLQLLFTEGILPLSTEFESLQIEHRWLSQTFVGQWLPLRKESGDYRLSYIALNKTYFVDINLKRLKNFVDRSIDWEIEIRMKFPDDENFVENKTVLYLQSLQRARLREFIIIER